MSTAAAFAKSPRFRFLLAGLLLADGALVALHLLHVVAASGGSLLRAFLPLIPALGAEHFRLDVERGLAEFGQYAKFAAIVAAMFVLHRRTGTGAFLVFGMISAVLLIDDAFRIHEFARHALVAAGMDFALADALGKLLFFCAVGGGGLAATPVLYRRAPTAQRPLILWFLALFAALALVGVGLDAVHALAWALTGSWRLHQILTLVEDAGELVILSVICASALSLRGGFGTDAAGERRKKAAHEERPKSREETPKEGMQPATPIACCTAKIDSLHLNDKGGENGVGGGRGPMPVERTRGRTRA